MSGNIQTQNSTGHDDNVPVIITSRLQSIQYTDGTHDYLCQSPPGTALAAEGWEVKKVEIAIPANIRYPVKNGRVSSGFEFAATDLGTVVAYTYQYGNPT